MQNYVDRIEFDTKLEFKKLRHELEILKIYNDLEFQKVRHELEQLKVGYESKLEKLNAEHKIELEKMKQYVLKFETNFLKWLCYVAISILISLFVISIIFSLIE